MDIFWLVLSLILLVIIIFCAIFIIRKKQKITPQKNTKNNKQTVKIANKINSNNNILDELIKSGVSQELSSQIFNDYKKTKNLYTSLEKYIDLKISGFENNENKPKVSIVLGINGAGKTTSIAKMASFYKNKGEKVILGAADTFRAAGSSQLKTWGDKLGIEVITGETGQDSASVAYKATKRGVDESFDRVIIDTSGRLQNNENLLSELKKIVNVVSKITPVDEKFLVLDSNIGNNSLSQAKNFSKVVDINAIFLSKFDSNSKPGIVFDIINQVQIPIKFLGVGEKEEDIEVFDKKSFLESFL